MSALHELSAAEQREALRRRDVSSRELTEHYLDRIDRLDFDPFHDVVDVAQWRRQWAMWRAARRFR